MAELADAADSKSAGPCALGGSIPPPGTIFALYRPTNNRAYVPILLLFLLHAGRVHPILVVAGHARLGARGVRPVGIIPRQQHVTPSDGSPLSRIAGDAVRNVSRSVRL